MDVDEERKPLPGRVKREIVEAEPKESEGQKGSSGHARGFDTTIAENASGKALDAGPKQIDEAGVRVEQENVNKASDQMFSKS
ncbi:hypothetical protein NC652_012051 [Populus alba x Populus x berolinensis]|nr:hypothetical protein NC652_012051 [Populus alba x Populus x berolinensis]